MLCNGSARPGHPGQQRKWLAKVPPRAFTVPLSLQGLPFVWFSYGLFVIFLWYSTIKYENVNIFSESFALLNHKNNYISAQRKPQSTKFTIARFQLSIHIMVNPGTETSNGTSTSGFHGRTTSRAQLGNLGSCSPGNTTSSISSPLGVLLILQSKILVHCSSCSASAKSSESTCFPGEISRSLGASEPQVQGFRSSLARSNMGKRAPGSSRLRRNNSPI